MKLKNMILMGLSSSILFACTNDKNNGDGNKQAHFLSSDFDTTVTLGNDFYQYTNGGWMNAHPIPGEKSRLNTFDVLNDENLERLKEIVETAQNSNAPIGSNKQKIGDFYALAMDTAKRDQEGISPIQSILDDIKKQSYNLQDSAFAQYIAYQHLHLGNPFFASACTPDAKNSSMNIAELWQEGIGLPNRDYYFDESTKGKEIIEGYKNMIAKYLQLLGGENCKQRAEAIYNFEKELASLMNTKVENRDPQKTYNKMSYDELKTFIPDFNWDAYFSSFPVKPTEITIGQPRFFKGIFPLMKQTDINVLNDYLTFCTINHLASYLSQDYMLTKFEFYSKQLGGVTELKPLWKRSLDMVQSRLGQPLGQLFVEKHFSENAKTRMIDLIEELRIAFGQRIDNLSWMSDSTKLQAKDKLAAITVKVGYPDVWEDYSNATVDKSLSLVENYINLTYFHSMKEMSEVGKPVDKNKWYMTPQTVNAYYNPLSNEIVFPAGILQEPFFYAEGDDAVNYGAIGVVIGHEMTHGFDDQGRQFDKEGNLHDWWTSSDAERFNQVAEKIKIRFSKVNVIDSLYCNGELTLGENIADLGGLNIAHQAFLNTLKAGEPEKLIDGQTYDQRFLYAYSRIWAGNYRDEFLRKQVITDPHANGKYRVNVQVPMLDFFYSAFGISENDSMYVKPEERIVIW
ncbi:MAG: M13 family metallopeptidase [Paludibacteraceae bacterium]|nr:M13 family metallopeptidase [Paludibacteraceae bacterium]